MARKTYVPPKPVTNDGSLSKFWMFMRWVWDCLAGGKFPFKSTDTVTWNWSGGFYWCDVKVPLGRGSSGVTSNFRGVYNPALIYNLLEEVVIQSGVSSGHYICTMDNNTNSPDTGIGWIQLANGQLGQWV